MCIRDRSKLDEYGDFQELDWQSLASGVAKLAEEKRLLEATSDVLQNLAVRLTRLQADLAQTEAALAEKTRDLGATQARREAAEALRQQTLALVSEAAQDTAHFARLGELSLIHI